MKADRLDLEILETYKELNPSAAFLQGFNQYAGKLFVPSSENIQGALRRVRELRRRAKTGLQEKFLDALEVALLFDEPQPILDDIVGNCSDRSPSWPAVWLTPPPVPSRNEAKPSPVAPAAKGFLEVSSRSKVKFPDGLFCW